MEEESKREKANEEFEKLRTEAQRKDEEKTSKNRRKREKRKAAAAAAKNKNGGASTAMDLEGDNNQNGDGEAGRKNKVPRLGPLPPRERNHDTEADYGNEGDQQVREEQGVIIHDDD